VDEKKAYFALLTEEYRLLGTAGIQAGQHTYTALQWGTAVVGVVVGAAISQWGKNDAVVELAFLVGVPTLVAVGMLYWVGEMARISRLSDFLCAVEMKVDLALQLSERDESSEWLEEFMKEWAARRAELMSEARVVMPVGPDGEVAIGGGPISFERWLREIRTVRARNNLIWVYLVRVLFFPAVMSASWATGVFYVLHTASAAPSWEQSLAVLAGLAISVPAVWFVAEIVTGLSPSTSSGARPAWPRRKFRRVLGRPLHISEWSDM
jgi:hypothetical protein